MLYTAAVITRFFTDGGDWIYQSWRQLSITLTILIGRPASISTPFINGWWVLERERKCFQGCCRHHLSLLDKCKLKLIQAPEKTTPLTYIFMGSTGTNNWGLSNNPEFMTWVTLKLMALPSSPFCVNWSHKANTDEHIQWWDLMRLLWVNSRNAAQRPSGSHTCGKVVGVIVMRLGGWLPVRCSGLQYIRLRRMV